MAISLRPSERLHLTVLRLKSLRSLSTAPGPSPLYDLIVVGAGIIGLATAREVALRHPGMKIAVVEKERDLGSLKARLCVGGAHLMYDYCRKKDILYSMCGKVIVAAKDEELPRLQQLYERGKENGVKDLRMIGVAELRELEPHCRGIRAIHSPYTGIVDWAQVARSYAEDFRTTGGHIYTNFKVEGFTVEQQSIKGTAGDILIQLQASDKPPLSCSHVITCCGLHSDRVAGLSGCSPEPRLVPFRGEYLLLRRDRCHLIRGNIYPVPDPKFPFLGVHFTPRMDGSVWLGPNAILAFSREGYSSTDFEWRDFKETVGFRGLRKLVMKYWRYGSVETYRSFFMAAQVKQLQKYVPEIRPEDITRGPTGVRAQAVDRDGNLVDDFVFDQGEGEMGARMLHVRNAPSPGATSSLAIAEMVADKAQEMFRWRR